MQITQSFAALLDALRAQNLSLGELALREQEFETRKSRGEIAAEFTRRIGFMREAVRLGIGAGQPTLSGMVGTAAKQVAAGPDPFGSLVRRACAYALATNERSEERRVGKECRL